MKIEELVENLIMPVDFYAKAIYDWDKHNENEAQSISDVNKERGFIKIFSDEYGNRAHILRAKNPERINPSITVKFDAESQQLMKKLLDKEFYFIGILENGKTMEDIFFPDEVFLELDDAVKGAIKYLEDLSE